MATVNDLEYLYLVGEGAEPGTINDMREEIFSGASDAVIRDFYVSESPLTPVGSFSVNDHKYAALLALLEEEPETSKNLLTLNQASFETEVPDSLVDIWDEGNEVSISSDVAWHGTKSLRINAAYEENYIEYGILVPDIEPGTEYTAHFALYSPEDMREIDARIMWRRANNTVISSSYSDPGYGTQNEWTIITITATSPALTAQAVLAWQYVTLDEPEHFYVDGLGLWLGDTTDWEAPLL
jgi:hypothetical protein